MSSTKDWKPRRVTSEEDRSGGTTDYISLNHETAPHFVGYPLFVGDPGEAEIGYYEYLEHWLNDTKKRVVCPGEDVCPICADGNRPKTRAKTLWLVTEDEKGNVIVNAETGEPEPKLKMMSFNFNLIKMFTGFRKAGDKYVGRLMRVTLTDDRGNYSIFPKDDTLTKTAFKDALKGPSVPNFEELVTAQLHKYFEGYELSAAMERSDAPVDPHDKPAAAAEPASAPKGKAEPEPEEPAGGEDWPASAEELIVIVESVSDDGNWFEAAHSEYEGTRKVWTTNDVQLDFATLVPAMAVSITGALDGDGEYVLSAEPEVAEAAPEEESAPELPKKIADVKAVVTGDVDTDNWTIPVNVPELDISFLLYILESAGPVDWADYKEGVEITIVEANRDSSGDLCTKILPTLDGGASAPPKGKGGPKKAEPAGKGKS